MYTVSSYLFLTWVCVLTKSIGCVQSSAAAAATGMSKTLGTAKCVSICEGATFCSVSVVNEFGIV